MNMELQVTTHITNNYFFLFSSE